MMASFTVSSWNCRGIKATTPVTTSKTDFLEAHFSTNPVDILALLETHHTGMEDLPTLFQGFALTHHLLHTPTQAPDTHGGMVVVLDKSKFDLIKICQEAYDRFWWEQITNSSKATTYVTFKTAVYYEKYFDHIGNAKLPRQERLLS